MQIFDRPTRTTITHQIATTTGTDSDRAALILQEVLDYGPTSGNFHTVLPILWHHLAGLARRAVGYADAVEEAVVQGLADDIDQTEAADQMFAEHPDLNTEDPR